MSKILCLYYSRTGRTRDAMEKAAEKLDAELVELTDGKKRSGRIGYFRCGFDAMKKTPDPLEAFHTQNPLGSYEKIILGTPVWAGRCSSVMRSFLLTHGAELKGEVSLLITHMGDSSYEQVFAQMDRYLPAPHREALSLQNKAEEYHRQLYDFVRAVAGEGPACPEQPAEEKQ